jgi:hypothetical protein
MSKKDIQKEEKMKEILEKHYLVNYIKEVYHVNPSVGNELMKLNNSLIENQISEATK